MENKKTNMTHIWPILLMLVILLAGGVIFYLLSQKAQPVEMEQTVVALTPTSQKPAPSNIAIPGYPELTLISDTGVIPAVFENPEGNPCYFKLDLIPDKPYGPQKTSNPAPVYKVLQLLLFPNLAFTMPSSVIRPPVSTT